jgi:addiction module HigA family antidote
MKLPARKNLRLPPVHPGKTLAGEIAARGLTVNALSLRLRLPPTRLNAIVRGQRGITAETALRLGRYFGTGSEIRMNLQTGYELALAEREFGAHINRKVEMA